MIYPPLVTQLDYGQANYDGPYRKLIPRGQLISFGAMNSGGPNLIAGATCEMTVSYQVRGGLTNGQTYSYRSCIVPRAW